MAELAEPYAARGFLQPRSFVQSDIDALLTRHAFDGHALLQILREAQALCSWLPRDLLSHFADSLKLPLAHVEGAATFYRFLHVSPVGEYRVLFSDNITDRMLGNVALLDDLCRRLCVERGRMRADGRVSVDFCSCTGMCDQGPSLLINHHQVVMQLDAARVAKIADLIESRVAVAAWPAEWSVVEDHVRRADVLLGTDFEPGAAIAVARERGALGVINSYRCSSPRAITSGALLLIENVGNLVCPALFDLGERAKVAILSVTEGDDKPLKYPHVFRASQLMLLNKMDLFPHVDFDIDAAITNAKQVNPPIQVLCVSAKTGDGLPAWHAWIEDQALLARAARLA